MKEFLAEHEVPAACKPCVVRAPRCNRRKLQYGVPFSMKKPSSHHKRRIEKLVKEGELKIGKEVVEEVQHSYTVDKKTAQVVEHESSIHSRKITLHDIRISMLKRQEKLGLLRESSDEYIERLTLDEIRERLCDISDNYCDDDDLKTLQTKLKIVSRQRFLKVWHDHSSVSGHGLLLVLASCIYDPALFYTTKEMKERTGRAVNVQSC